MISQFTRLHLNVSDQIHKSIGRYIGLVRREMLPDSKGFISEWNLRALVCILSKMYYIVQSQETLKYLYSEQSENKTAPKWTWEFDHAKHFDSFSAAASAVLSEKVTQNPVVVSVSKSNSVIWGIHYLDRGIV